MNIFKLTKKFDNIEYEYLDTTYADLNTSETDYYESRLRYYEDLCINIIKLTLNVLYKSLEFIFGIVILMIAANSYYILKYLEHLIKENYKRFY